MFRFCWSTKTVYFNGLPLIETAAFKISWGHDGISAQHLALAMLAEVSGLEDARKLTQDFTHEIVKNMPMDDFVLTETVVKDWVREKKSIEGVCQ